MLGVTQLRNRIEFLKEALEECRAVLRKIKQQSKQEQKEHLYNASFGYANVVEQTYKQTTDRLESLMTNWSRELSGARRRLKALVKTKPTLKERMKEQKKRKREKKGRV